MTKGIPYFDNINFCPVKALNKWDSIEAELKKVKFLIYSDKQCSSDN